jgi:hypothetical protein
MATFRMGGRHGTLPIAPEDELRARKAIIVNLCASVSHCIPGEGALRTGGGNETRACLPNSRS